MANSRTENTNSRTIFTLTHVTNVSSGSEVDVPFNVTDVVRKLVDALSPMFKDQGEIQATPERVTRIGDDHASSIIDCRQAEITGMEGKLKAISESMKASCKDVVTRYAGARRSAKEIRRTVSDKRVLRINELAWYADRCKWELWMFPDEEFKWKFDAVAPETLDCNEPEEFIEESIENVRVLGTYENQIDVQLDLLDMSNTVPWIIVIEHERGQIQHLMTRSRGQDINRGITYLSAMVRGKVGELPVVVGDVELRKVKPWVADDSDSTRV